MGCYGNTAKGAFGTLFPLEIGYTYFLGVFEDFCSQIISSRRGDRTGNTKRSFSLHFSVKLGEREQDEVSRGTGNAIPSS